MDKSTNTNDGAELERQEAMAHLRTSDGFLCVTIAKDKTKFGPIFRLEMGPFCGINLKPNRRLFMGENTPKYTLWIKPFNKPWYKEKDGNNLTSLNDQRTQAKYGGKYENAKLLAYGQKP